MGYVLLLGMWGGFWRGSYGPRDESRVINAYTRRFNVLLVSLLSIIIFRRRLVIHNALPLVNSFSVVISFAKPAGLIQ